MGKYVLKDAGTNEYMFNLHAGNSEIILTSQRYSSKAGAENGIASVQANSPADGNYDRLTSTANQPYFTLKAANNAVIGTSQMYSSTQARDGGIESVKSNGPTKTIDDQTT